jgi:hypothetical protein
MAIITLNNNSLSSVTSLPAAIDTGAMVLLTSASISSTTSSIAINSPYVSSTYDHYRLHLRGKAAGDYIKFNLRYRNSANTGNVTSNYSWRVSQLAANGAGSNSDGVNNISLTNEVYIGNNTNEGFNMTLDFMSPNSTTVPTSCHWKISAANNSDAFSSQVGMARRNDGTETHAGFILYWDNGGDFAAGTNYEFYGLQK